MTQQEIEKALMALINRIGTGSGPVVPLPQVGQNVVPPVTNLVLNQTSAGPVGTNFTLSWNDVAGVNTILVDHYIISAVNPTNTSILFSQTTTQKSPGTINVLQKVGTTVRLTVQTVLASGQVNQLPLCPSVSGTCTNGAVAFT